MSWQKKYQWGKEEPRMSTVWTQLDDSTWACEIEGLGVMVKTGTGLTYVQGAKIEGNRVVSCEGVEESEEEGGIPSVPELPFSATEPGWPDLLEGVHTDGNHYWYKLYWQADSAAGKSATYQRYYEPLPSEGDPPA